MTAEENMLRERLKGCKNRKIEGVKNRSDLRNLINKEGRIN